MSAPGGVADRTISDRTIFVTGATGFLGSYVVTELLRRTPAKLALLVRARDEREAVERLWRSLQLHLDGPGFAEALPRVRFVLGDLHEPDLGLVGSAWRGLAAEVDSVVHVAASLNRKSSKACFNTNLRGTLTIIRLARAAAEAGGLRRYSHVSTVAVAGERRDEVVTEDEAVDWSRSDYDPYARTKKFCEHMALELLPDVEKTFFRPSIVMGDSRFPDTTQFDMVQAFCGLADLPVLPFRPTTRLDIVNADFVGEAVARLHLAERPRHLRYHLSAGAEACTKSEILAGLRGGGRGRPFVPSLERSAGLGVRALNRLPRRTGLQGAGAVLKVFWPYITYDTVFDNARVREELGLSPVPFPQYCRGLYEYAKRVRFRYPYRPLPAGIDRARGSG